MNGFELTRAGAVVGRLTFEFDELEEWTTRDVRLVDFTDRQLERQLQRILDRNEPRLTVSGRAPDDLGRFFEGLQAALWYLKSRGNDFEYSSLETVPPRVEDPLAEY